MERDRYLICVVPFLQVSNRASDLCLLSAVKTCRCITLAWPTHRSQIERYFHKLQAHYRISVRLCARLSLPVFPLSLSLTIFFPHSIHLLLSLYLSFFFLHIHLLLSFNCSFSIFFFSIDLFTSFFSLYPSFSLSIPLSFFLPLSFFSVYFVRPITFPTKYLRFSNLFFLYIYVCICLSIFLSLYLVQSYILPTLHYKGSCLMLLEPMKRSFRKLIFHINWKPFVII
jgi:hypothetical protein